MDGAGRWIDVTMPLRDGLRSNHSRPGEEVRLTYDIDPKVNGGTKTVRRINTRLHVGTHVDGPEHLILGAQRLDELPLDTFAGAAAIVDMSNKVPCGIITADDLDVASEERVRPGHILVIRTGWSTRYSQPNFYSDSPYMHPDAADWIVSKRVKLVVVDFLADPIAPELQIGGPDAFKIAVLQHGVPVVTNANNLERITSREVLFFGFPISVVPSEAAPARAVVWEPATATGVGE